MIIECILRKSRKSSSDTDFYPKQFHNNFILLKFINLVKNLQENTEVKLICKGSLLYEAQITQQLRREVQHMK